MRPVYYLASILALVGGYTRRSASDELRGFSADGARVERDWETRMRAIPDPARMRESMRLLSAHPHHVGSMHDRQNAEWLLAQFKSFGWDAHIEQFDVLFPTPIERVVELVAPTRFTAKLMEPTVAIDPTSQQHDEQLPTYNAYSADGDVTGRLVYVNYGIPADYEALDRRGISVKGAIVITRYGGSWRGIKPKVAAEHGAIGCLIYSDPADDGYGQGAVFPAGPFRPGDGVQRGSVEDMPTYPGDPLTPGVGAVPGAKRLAIADAKTITTIPVLPLSYADATPLLSALTGPVAPEAWRGGLPLTYRMGPGAAQVHLRVKSDWSLKPLYDVIAILPGRSEGDQWIIRGNHHDAWVNGADDPISGLVAELEEARALGALVKQGWRPRRTIIYAAWDGEEPGLLGSTEWVEMHADSLRQHAVAYLNSDTNERGYLNLEGSHTLETLLNDVAADIVDPETHVSVEQRLRLQHIRFGGPEERAAARSTNALQLGALGSGSDFTPFLQHLGIASLNLGYGGEDNGGVYHSIYDDFYWYSHFADTAFVYGRALAQTAATAVMRLADAEVLPFDFRNLGAVVHRYLGEIEALATSERDSAVERNRELGENVFGNTNDPRRSMLPPPAQPEVPHPAFAPLHNAADSLTRTADRYERALQLAMARDTAIVDPAGVNQLLLQSERKLTSSAGLPGRPWYVHLLYAPGFYTGYGVKTMPGVREAIEQRQWALADEEILRLAQAVDAEAALIADATAKLARGVNSAPDPRR